ncbi:MAG: hypothetical protein OXL96_15795, partial [Candidatus Poribacteria bacterium]|nr:hypothetical protein [Candidatus Poribacteria bacterium]
KTMLSELHYKILENANRELSRQFQKLRKARASRDTDGIKRAEMDYYQSLQHLYAAVQDAVADGNQPSPVGGTSDSRLS